MMCLTLKHIQIRNEWDIEEMHIDHPLLKNLLLWPLYTLLDWMCTTVKSIWIKTLRLSEIKWSWGFEENQKPNCAIPTTPSELHYSSWFWSIYSVMHFMLTKWDIWNRLGYVNQVLKYFYSYIRYFPEW